MKNRGIGKIFSRAQGVDAIERFGRDLAAAQKIGFGAVLHGSKVVNTMMVNHNIEVRFLNLFTKSLARKFGEAT